MSQLTTATKKLSKLRKRIRGIAGGTSAGKTISILQILIDKAQSDKTPKITSVVSESMPHLKRGAIRDFVALMNEHGYFKDDRWNKTDYIYTFETGSVIEFFSVDQTSKVRGPRRDRLFINEANNVPYDTFDQLEIRTKEEVWMDWNPTIEFWFYTDILNQREDVDFEILTYKDNEALDPAIVRTIESHKNNKNWWLVYGMGQLGEVEGKIYRDWAQMDEIPFNARLMRRGLDFGYSNDPAALIDIYYFNGGYIFDEQLYSIGMSNKRIAELIKNLNANSTPVMTVADSAEPKSIDEIMSYGVPIQAANKGPGSVNQGISYIQDQRISVTKRSINLLKEYRNYLWMTDKEGKILTIPQDFDNHALDAIRYAMESIRPPDPEYNQRGLRVKQLDFQTPSYGAL